MTLSIHRLFLLAAAFSAAALIAYAQAPAPAAVNTVGVVTKIDVSAREIMLRTDAGADVSITIQANASFRKVAPGESDLRNATAIAIADLNVGDRVLARGRPSADQKALTAVLVVVMSKTDIANKQAQDKADWDRRGVIGPVTAINGDEFTIAARGAAGGSPLVIVAAKDTIVRRYAPGSVKFVDAKPSTLAAIKIGDQVRARGDKTEDGAKMTAEEIVSGSFRTIAVTVNAIDAAAGIARVTNLDGKKLLIVIINPDSVLRKLPMDVAQSLAARNRPPAGGTPNTNRGTDLQQMLDRAAKITLADLKPGDAVIVSSTEGTAPDQITAITLVAGVEPILTAPGRKDMALGSWSLDMDGGGGQ
jgi:Domain of unknown function (DUF5666)